MKVYLDNVLISAWDRNDLKPQKEAAAFETIKRGLPGVELVTSPVSKQEIERIPAGYREPIEARYEQLEKVPYTEAQTLLRINSYGDAYTWICSPVIEDEPVWVDFVRRGLCHTDAHHVAHAVREGCEVFLTNDSRSILKRHDGAVVKHALTKYNIQLMKPTQFIAWLSASA